jgi:hypothetical protein
VCGLWLRRARLEADRGLKPGFFAAVYGAAESSKTGKEEYFRMERASNCIDRGAAEVQTSCCGVNLAFVGFGVSGFGLRGFFSCEL